MRWGWKTILGGVITAVGHVASTGISVESLTTGFGIVLGAIGVRHAIEKQRDR